MAELHRETNLIEKRATDNSELEKRQAELRSNLQEARKMAGVYKKELELAEKEIRYLSKKSGDSPSLKKGTNHNPIAQVDGRMKDLEKRCNALQQKLTVEQQEKEEAFKRLRIYMDELEKQEAFFKKELEGMADLLEGNGAGNESGLDAPLIDQVISRFNILQSTLKNEREQHERSLLRDKEMAQQVPLVLSLYSGVYFDSAIGY